MLLPVRRTIAISWYNKEFLSIKNASFSRSWCMLTLSQEKSNYKVEGSGNDGYDMVFERLKAKEKE